jgi:hypothetical protein
MTDLTPLALHIVNATGKGRSRRKLPRAYRLWLLVEAAAGALALAVAVIALMA